MSKKLIYTILLSFLLISCNQYTINKNVVKFDGQSFTILSSGLISVKSSEVEKGNFNYESQYISFEVEQNGDNLIISTDKCKLFYTKGKEILIDRIQIEFHKNNATVLSAINQKDTKNLGGVIKSVDRCDGRLEYKEYDTNSETTPLIMPNGLLSEQGFTVLKTVDGKLVHNDISSEGNEYFIFCYGEGYKQALQDFIGLNGKIPLLPKWTLGNWFSRYQPLTAENYKDIVKRFRKEKIPIDVIVPDMNWHIDGWFGTRYDSVKFPNMAKFLEWTNENGLHVGFNHHPGAVIKDDKRSKEFVEKINMDYDSLRIATEKQYEESKWEFIENALFYGEGNSDHIKPFFEVFLNPIMDEGLDFHWVDGTPSIENLREYYNLTEQHSNKRAIVLTRQISGSFDHHKYPIGFSADTYISWESLKYNIELTVTGANVGVYWSHDIGGHMERFPDIDNTEMFARWIQSGAMSSFNRLHATGGVEWDSRKQHVRKPWGYGKTLLSAARDILQLKYKLLPYTYSLNRKAHDNGLLICYGMYMDYPSYTNAYKYSSSQYMFGSDMLIAPITEPAGNGKGIKGEGFKNVWIPEGTWYDYFSGEEIKGPLETLVSKPINEMPIFIKEGAIIPMEEYMEYTNQKPLNYLIVEFYQPTKAMKNSFSLYEDDGESLDYKDEQFRWTKIEYNFDVEKGTSIIINPVVGSYKNEVKDRSYQLVIKHLKLFPSTINLNGQQLPKENWKISNNELIINTSLYDVNKKVIIEFS